MEAFLVTLILMCLFSSEICHACPYGYWKMLDNCYYLSNNKLKWSEAEESCELGNGHLTSVLNGLESSFLTDKIADVDCANFDNYWSGGNNLVDGVTWQWSDGRPFNYTKWKPGFPIPGNTFQCISTDRSNGYFANENCNQPKRFVCKFPQSSFQSCPSCKIGYEMHEGFCYKVFHGMITWSDAEAACVQQEAHLVSIHSIEENNFIRDLLLAQPTDSSPDVCDDGPWVWIGIWDPLQNLNVTWTDGTSVTFTNWALDHPIPNYCGEGVHGTYLGYTAQWQARWWFILSSMHQAFYVCKMPPQ